MPARKKSSNKKTKSLRTTTSYSAPLTPRRHRHKSLRKPRYATDAEVRTLRKYPYKDLRTINKLIGGVYPAKLSKKDTVWSICQNPKYKKLCKLSKTKGMLGLVVMLSGLLGVKKAYTHVSQSPDTPTNSGNSSTKRRHSPTGINTQIRNNIHTDKKTTKCIKVATVNLFNNEGTNMISTLKTQLSKYKPDIVVFQEASKHKIELPDYSVIQWGGPRIYEFMGAVLLNNSDWKNVSEVQKFSTEKCKTNRQVFKITLQHKKDPTKTIKIANIHLCGGRFDEGTHQKCNNPPNSLDCQIELTNIKNESIAAVVSADVDIILGDFNSDVNNYINGTPLEVQRKYLEKKNWTLKQINTWNTAPFEYLTKAGFKLVQPEDQTSWFGGTPDVIWYNPLKYKYIFNNIIDMGATTAISQKSGASDHNGVMAQFSLI
jgi:hypothetical protein